MYNFLTWDLKPDLGQPSMSLPCGSTIPPSHLRPLWRCCVNCNQQMNYKNKEETAVSVLRDGKYLRNQWKQGGEGALTRGRRGHQERGGRVRLSPLESTSARRAKANKTVLTPGNRQETAWGHQICVQSTSQTSNWGLSDEIISANKPDCLLFTQ